MSALNNLETKLNDVFVKNAPFQIPENGRKWIATYAWVFALIGLVLGVFAAFAIFAVLGLTSTVTNVTYLGVPVEANRYLALAWIAFIVLVGYLVVLGMSVPKLKAMQKSGWNLTFYSTLFFAGYDVFNWLQYPSVGLFSLIWNLLGVAVSLYVLFQIRSYFTK